MAALAVIMMAASLMLSRMSVMMNTMMGFCSSRDGMMMGIFLPGKFHAATIGGYGWNCKKKNSQDW